MVRLTVGVLVAGLWAHVAPAAEPWADPKLPVTDGLELWLDAAHIGPPAAGIPADVQPFDTWFDASGHRRHLKPATPAARPVLAHVGPDRVVRFDGEKTHLRLVGPAVDLAAVTVVIVAVPRSNFGGHRGLIAFNAPGQPDFKSGLCIDLGPDASAELDQLNVEGHGFAGARNLLRTPTLFDTPHALELQVPAVAGTVRLFADGTPAGERPREPDPISMAEVTVGARYFTNGPGPQQARGFAHVDVAEVLVYSRSLGDDEARRLRQYLDAKYARLRRTLTPVRRGTPLVRVPDPPVVQMLVPGFTVRELPVDLPNVNNVRYRPDGSLIALCYNGDVYRLRDTDADGLEDRAELFWDNKGRLIAPIGMDLTPPGYPHGDGLFVACKGKCSLIVDTDKDGKADKEIVVATGWPGTFVSVDALGVAIDRRDGSVYFGLGCANFADAYDRDKDGRAKYSLNNERGTIMRVSPDFKAREIVATGIRFSVALAFNRHGDLFATDQEGATWLPNGNPFDELLHIQTGRHYGFPPRHPKHVPNVIDEPSVFDYGPQHQSACGLFFNEPVNGGRVFGPPEWQSDALVTGESRGKLYRTQLVKTPAGYVARNQIIACLNMLTIDACGTPDGGVVVACHSGRPDWGTGPSGHGKLFKITYTGRDHPQPVCVWPSGPREVRVAFDRPVDPALAHNLPARAALAAGRYVRAGDRFESLKPGYQAVQAQLVTPRYDVPVQAVQLTPDRRTLILATGPHAEAVHYALTLPVMGRPEATPTGAIRQAPQIDLDYDLSGVEARWRPAAGGEAWAGWLPHPDLAVARALTAGSAAHDPLWAALATPGELTVRTQFDLTDMLRPAVQPGSKIDYDWPAEEITLTFRTSDRMSVISPVGRAEAGDGYTSRLTVRPTRGQTVPVEVRMLTNGRVPALAVSYHTAEDPRERPLELRRALVPWAVSRSDAFDAPAAPAPVPELAGGDWARGRAVFLSDAAACVKCHAVRGQGGAIGPDLSNLVHRDYASVLRDVAEPSAAINPDYVTYRVSLKDGRVLTGAVRTDGDKLLVGDLEARVTTVRRSDVDEMTPTASSIMPEGLPQALGPDRMRDLLMFLLTPPPVSEAAPKR
jgi:putative heme-binding domain-containing protein